MMNFQFYIEPPDLSLQGQIEIEALTPLSMVPTQPGVYYRTHQAPTKQMLMGMFENALGWHFSEEIRKDMIKSLAKAAKKAQGKNILWKDHPWLLGKSDANESGYISLLQYHLETRLVHQPPIKAFDDLWSQHLRDVGGNFVGGSRNYDYRLEPLIEKSRTQDENQPKVKGKHPKFIEFGDRKEHQAIDLLEELLKQQSGKIKAKSIHPYFPRYYVSPKVRGYIIPEGSYRYQVHTTTRLAAMLKTVIDNPAAPLYLGTNDGWINLKWKNHDEL